MSNSPLVDYTKILPNSTNPRRDKIRKITIHHMAGNLSVETCGDIFASLSRKASSNYGVRELGRIIPPFFYVKYLVKFTNLH